MKIRRRTQGAPIFFRGLTILELVVAISVIAILAALTGAGVIGILAGAGDAASSSILNSLKSANDALFLKRMTEGGGAGYTMWDLMKTVDIRGADYFVASDCTLQVKVNGVWHEYQLVSTTLESDPLVPWEVVQVDNPSEGRKSQNVHQRKKEKEQGPKKDRSHFPKD